MVRHRPGPAQRGDNAHECQDRRGEGPVAGDTVRDNAGVHEHTKGEHAPFRGQDLLGGCTD
eukprot:10772598-Alexandrium_andersonii.AAC.1